MRTLLERAIVHLLNGDEDKAAEMFHKFMVERARQIHESLREGNGDDALDENWDSEITEEEYFGDDDLGDEGDDAAPAMDADGDDVGDEMTDDMGDDAGDDMGGDDAAPIGDDVDAGDEDFGDDMGDLGDESEPGVEGKIDELTDKIDELTAEFDRVMAEFHGEHDDMDGIGDDMPDHDDAAPEGDFGGDDMADGDTEEDGDLAGRMEDDMGDMEAPENEPMAEAKPDFLKKKEEDEELDECDDDLKDITESVLAELDKIAAPANVEHKGVGGRTAPDNVTAGNNTSPIPHHNVMDRIKGKPVMTKGPTHDGYEREAAPPVKDPNNLVKNVRKGNRRNSFKDTMGNVPANGDGSANLNKDFAGGVKPTQSIVDGKKAGNK